MPLKRWLGLVESLIRFIVLLRPLATSLLTFLSFSFVICNMDIMTFWVGKKYEYISPSMLYI